MLLALPRRTPSCARSTPTRARWCPPRGRCATRSRAALWAARAQRRPGRPVPARRARGGRLRTLVRAAPRRRAAARRPRPRGVARRRRALARRSWSTTPRARSPGRRGLRLDLGGSGKGHVADRVAALLAPARSWVVDCGGDVRLGGTHEVHVAHPLGGPPAARLTLADAAVATSSVVRRAWRGDDGAPRHHLLDPATGAPAWSRRARRDRARAHGARGRDAGQGRAAAAGDARRARPRRRARDRRRRSPSPRSVGPRRRRWRHETRIPPSTPGGSPPARRASSRCCASPSPSALGLAMAGRTRPAARPRAARRAPVDGARRPRGDRRPRHHAARRRVPRPRPRRHRGPVPDRPRAAVDRARRDRRLARRDPRPQLLDPRPHRAAAVAAAAQGDAARLRALGRPHARRGHRRVGEPWMRVLLLVTGAPILFLFLLRVLPRPVGLPQAARRRDHARVGRRHLVRAGAARGGPGCPPSSPASPSRSGSPA